MLGQDDLDASNSQGRSSIEPTLNDLTRMRLGRELQVLYEPVIDEPLDPRLAELMRQLDADRGQ